MQTNRILCLSVSLVFLLENYSSANNINEQIDKKVYIKFEKNGECTVKCDNDKEQHFANLNSLSDGINNITNGYFTVSAIGMNHYDNSIVFQDFNYTYTNENNYQLFIEGSDRFNPHIVLDYINNNKVVPEINLRNIDKLHIIVDSIDNVKVDYIYNSAIDKWFVNCETICNFIDYK